MGGREEEEKCRPGPGRPWWIWDRDVVVAVVVVVAAAAFATCDSNHSPYSGCSSRAPPSWPAFPGRGSVLGPEEEGHHDVSPWRETQTQN